MEKLRVLIVEDEAIAAMALEMELSALRPSLIEIVSSGEAAVVAAREFRPELIFMDIHLDGELNGIDAVRQIHAQAKIPVVYTTASQNPEIEKQIAETEFVDLLHKPYLTVEITKILFDLGRGPAFNANHVR